MKEYIQETSGESGATLVFHKVEGNGDVKDLAEFCVFYNEYYNQIGIYMISYYDNTYFSLQILFPQYETPIVSHISFDYKVNNKLYFETIGTIEHKKYDETTPFTVHGFKFYHEYTKEELAQLMDLCNLAIYNSVIYFGKYFCPEIGLTLSDFRFNKIKF